MSTRIIKTIGILLALSFLLSVTAAASTDPVVKSGDTGKNVTPQKIALLKNNAGLATGKRIHIRNLIIAKNVIIINGSTKHPLLRAAALKGALIKKGKMTTVSTAETSKGC
jgi:hypothetical protein